MEAIPFIVPVVLVGTWNQYFKYLSNPYARNDDLSVLVTYRAGILGKGKKKAGNLNLNLVLIL